MILKYKQWKSAVYNLQQNMLCLWGLNKIVGFSTLHNAQCLTHESISMTEPHEYQHQQLIIISVSAHT
jgi:hypothetical protein